TIRKSPPRPRRIGEALRPCGPYVQAQKAALDRAGLLLRTTHYFFDDRFFAGTFLPLRRASERPIATACLRLFTVPPRPPLPRFRVPRLRRRMALLTSFDALREYLRGMACSRLPLNNNSRRWPIVPQLRCGRSRCRVSAG